MTPLDKVTLAMDPPEAGSDPTRWIQVQEARKTLDEAAGAARLVGFIFIALGVALIVPLLDRRLRAGLQLVMVANALVLIGPGAWYVLAANLIRRLERRAATVAIRVAVVQGVLVAAGLGLAGWIDSRDPLFGVARPALLAMFFMPALAALTYNFWRARTAMNLIGGGGAGFEALAPRPVLPLDMPGAGADAVEPPVATQGSDSLRGK